ncbi:MAG: hypothetical protein ACREEM_27450 [Blastocatellia bacterium]
MSEITLEYVEKLADQLPVEDQRRLGDYLSLKLKNGSAPNTPVERKPQDLYGIWRDVFPDDLDIEAALYEIRHEWEAELEEFKP